MNDLRLKICYIFIRGYVGLETEKKNGVKIDRKLYERRLPIQTYTCRNEEILMYDCTLYIVHHNSNVRVSVVKLCLISNM